MLVTLPESPAVAFGTPSSTLPKDGLAAVTRAAASVPEVAEAHLISFREMQVMKSSTLALVLITRIGSTAQDVARRVHTAMLKLAPGLEWVAVIGVPIDHRFVDPIRCAHHQLVFDYGRN